MCRWLAYFGSPICLEDLLYAPEHSLIDQGRSAREGKIPVNGDGFGIGWYGRRPEPGIYHEVLPVWNDRNLRSLHARLTAACCLPISGRQPARPQPAATVTPSPLAAGCSCIMARSAAT